MNAMDGQAYLFDPGDDRPDSVWLKLWGLNGLDFSGRVPRWVRDGFRRKASHDQWRNAAAYIRNRITKEEVNR